MLRLLDRLEETLVAVFIAAATLIIFAAVVHRYSLSLLADVVGYSRREQIEWLSELSRSAYFGLRSVNLLWAQEACIYLFVWMAKFGAAYGVRTGIHVGVDILLNRLPPARQRVMVLFGLLAGATFTAIIGTLGADFVWHIRLAGTTSPDLEVEMWLIYLAVPLGSFLMCFRFLQVAWIYLRTGDLPSHDHGHVDGVDEDADAAAMAAGHHLPHDR
ncbi:TRAP transporter small permease [Zavarzinia compransoris]|uniref:TRAP transporter small permease n=1 Tax=Zavarzinia marina TaxID=2911065 RepID=UPI001F42331B|nr:TRAP transporter small permease [Zavarzinia marina]MCF4165643.1 TRAP transporter small permease [Zavarzinia marina]